MANVIIKSDERKANTAAVLQAYGEEVMPQQHRGKQQNTLRCVRRKPTQN